MTTQATHTEALIGQTKGLRLGGRTHPRVQVISLSICAGASAAIVAVAHVAWFGSITGDPSVPQYSAVSGSLVPPRSPAGLVPGTQNWGYLLVTWSALIACLAVVAALACVVLRARDGRGVNRLLLGLGVASLILIAFVVTELTTRVPFDEVSFASADWGAIVGLGLAVLSSIGAWFAWATWTYPHRWGLESSASN